MSSRPIIRHIVFFSARDQADVPRIVDGLSELEKTGLASVFEVRENLRRDELSSVVDVALYAEFPDEPALAAYKAHPLYQKAISVVRPLRELRIAADI